MALRVLFVVLATAAIVTFSTFPRWNSDDFVLGVAKEAFAFQVSFQANAVQDENLNGVGEFALLGQQESLVFPRAKDIPRAVINAYHSLCQSTVTNGWKIFPLTPRVDVAGHVVFVNGHTAVPLGGTMATDGERYRLLEYIWGVRISQHESGSGWLVIGGGTGHGYRVWANPIVEDVLLGPPADRFHEVRDADDLGFVVRGKLLLANNNRRIR